MKQMAGRERDRFRRFRREAFDAQGGKCFWCGVGMFQPEEESARDRTCTGDHLIMRVNGGKTTRRNIVAACRKCNSGRHEDYTAARTGPGRATLADVWPCVSPAPKARKEIDSQPQTGK